uniref:UV-stimulated scaffold protein A C-terminal domain-containing protein n=1 Tax=Clastoptera arizonana TaxID=38151 RepID=A0A1B6EA27_9HEMI
MELKRPKKTTLEDLSKAIKDITHSGQKGINQLELDKIINLCKISEKYVQQAYHLIISDLEKNHSEIRYSAFQLCDDLFRRSSCFRSLIVSDMQHIFELSLETNSAKPLPQPRSRAIELKRLALKAVYQWHHLYGKEYKKLAIGFSYLQRCKKVDFSNFTTVDAVTHFDIERSRRQSLINEERKKKILVEIKDMEPEIRSSIKSLSNCINLLIPEPDHFFINENDFSEMDNTYRNNIFKAYENKHIVDEECIEEGESSSWREVGMPNLNHSVQLLFTPSKTIEINETTENSSILENAKGFIKLINNRYMPSVNSWIQSLTLLSGSQDEIKQLLDTKEELQNLLRKYNNLNIHTYDEVSTDSELEEVKESHIKEIVYKKRKTSCEDAWRIQSDNISKETKQSEHISSNSNQNEAQRSTSKEVKLDRKKKLLSVAPKRPYDIDLYHWEDPLLPTPTMIPVNAEGSRFWASTCDELNEVPVPGGSTSLRTRVIEFTGKFEPITHTCRAPLPSGKLCPRKDKFKCPFHGAIVQRNDFGQCTNPEDAERLALLAEKQQKETPDWQDPILLKEIEAQTGLDLKIPEKGKRKTKRKYPGLTDVKAKHNNTTNRLMRKVFNRSSVRKVATSLDKFDRRRFKDKFGDNFNYVYDK